MIYEDLVYGKMDIKEPVILELIDSIPVQRLKGITQHGPSVYNKYYKKRIVTRFEHSVGVYLLLKKLNTPLEEQIAGLLHDIGHTVFSHLSDYLFPEENREYDKKFFESLIKKSEIPKILEKYKLNLKRILDDSNFPILEQPLPNLCADRIDYFLRDPFLPGNFNRKEFLDNLIIIKNKIVFGDTNVALRCAKKYVELNDIFWAHPAEEFFYFIMVDVIRYSLNKGVIKHSDLFLTEENFLLKLKNLKDLFIDNKLKLLQNLNRKKFINSKKELPSGYFVKSKIRIIDPPVLKRSKIRRLSSINPKYKEFSLRFYKERYKGRWVGYEK